MCSTDSRSRWHKTWLKLFKGWFVLELKKLLKLSVPITLSILFQISLQWVSLLFLGHLPHQEESDSYQYPAAGLASSFINVTGIAVGHGIASASDTLSSQAYGYKNYKRVGVILQRGILILGLVMFPIWALWLNSESLLLLVQQPPCIARFSALYINLYTLALPFIFFYILLQHYLQSQSIVWQFALIGLLANVINVILQAITIYGIEIGFLGSVVSLVISNMLPPLMVIVYVWCRKLHKETWGGWSFESLEEWGLFMKLAIPGALMLALEWWSFEIINFLAGSLGEVELSTNILFFQVLVILFMPTIGLAIATSVRVGNELGAGNPQGAKRTSLSAIATVVVFSVASSILILSTKDVLSQVFVPGDEQVAERTSKLMLTGFIFVMCDNLQAVIGGALRGSGRQYIGAIVNFIAYYIIGLPLGAVICFKADMGILGIWIGMSIGNFTQCVVFVVILLRTNWEKLSQKAIQRAQKSCKPDSEDEPTEEKPSEGSDTSSLNSMDSVVTCSAMDTETLLSDVELEDVAVENDKENTVQTPSDQPSSYRSKSLSCKMRRLLIRGSFFVLGASILITGGVSSRYHPYVDPEEYYNCTTSQNSSYFTNSSFS